MAKIETSTQNNADIAEVLIEKKSLWTRFSEAMLGGDNDCVVNSVAELGDFLIKFIETNSLEFNVIFPTQEFETKYRLKEEIRVNKLRSVGIVTLVKRDDEITGYPKVVIHENIDVDGELIVMIQESGSGYSMLVSQFPDEKVDLEHQLDLQRFERQPFVGGTKAKWRKVTN